jgi:virulence-associated protein VapD
MEVGAMPRKIMEGRLFTGRRKERPRLRWMDDGVTDVRIMQIKQWTENTNDREQWRLVVN